MLKVLAGLIWVIVSLPYWAIVLIGAGFAGLWGAVFVLTIGLALWLPATALLTDWAGLTKIWPHNR